MGIIVIIAQLMVLTIEEWAVGPIKAVSGEWCMVTHQRMTGGQPQQRSTQWNCASDIFNALFPFCELWQIMLLDLLILFHLLNWGKCVCSSSIMFEISSQTISQTQNKIIVVLYEKIYYILVWTLPPVANWKITLFCFYWAKALSFVRHLYLQTLWL